MKKRNVFLIVLLLGVLSYGCTQSSKNNIQKEEQQLVKEDAQEYLTAIKKAAQSEEFGDSGLAGLLSIGLDADVRIKKKSILQKYQGDALVAFSEALKEEYKDRTGKDKA